MALVSVSRTSLYISYELGKAWVVGVPGAQTAMRSVLDCQEDRTVLCRGPMPHSEVDLKHTYNGSDRYLGQPLRIYIKCIVFRRECGLRALRMHPM